MGISQWPGCVWHYTGTADTVLAAEYAQISLKVMRAAISHFDQMLYAHSEC